MDEILEALLDLILDVAVDVGADQRMPKWLRTVACGIAAVFFWGALVIALLVCVPILQESPLIGGLLLLAIGAIFAGAAFACFRKWRKRRQEKELEPLEREWQSEKDA